MRAITMLLGLAIMNLGIAAASVPDDPHKVVPIAVNAKAPTFTAKEVDGRDFKFDPTSLRQPTLLIFYRGGWCPYCNKIGRAHV